MRPTKLKTIFKSQEIKVVVGILRWRISGGWGKMKISSMQPPSEWNLAWCSRALFSQISVKRHSTIGDKTLVTIESLNYYSLRVPFLRLDAISDLSHRDSALFVPAVAEPGGRCLYKYPSTQFEPGTIREDRPLFLTPVVSWSPLFAIPLKNQITSCGFAVVHMQINCISTRPAKRCQGSLIDPWLAVVSWTPKDGTATDSLHEVRLEY